MMRGRLVHSPLSTEFGRVLASLVLAAPGAVAAVLSDEEGDAIDFVHDPRVISELDVQLVGAQIGQAIIRRDESARRHVGGGALLVEAEHQAFAACAVAERYVLALVLERHANFARALDLLVEGGVVLVPLLT